MITTLTLNPVFDVHVNIESFRYGKENLADSRISDIGGKGINITRVLRTAGVDSRAILALPRENGAAFLSALKAEGIEPTIIECDGSIRENITIHEANGTETRLCFKGFVAKPELLSKAEALIDAGGIVAFSGSLPVGINAADTEAFLTRLRERGGKLVVDSKSVTLDMLRRIKPWLIKPNGEECEEYFGELDEEGLCRAALRLNADGIENVMISLGGDGAMLATNGKIYRARVPKTEVLSTIGAGDSTVSGFIAADGKAPEEQLRIAVSFGTAACLVSGTKPPKSEDVKRIYDAVTVAKITL